VSLGMIRNRFGGFCEFQLGHMEELGELRRGAGGCIRGGVVFIGVTE